MLHKQESQDLFLKIDINRALNLSGNFDNIFVVDYKFVNFNKNAFFVKLNNNKFKIYLFLIIYKLYFLLFL